VRCADIGSLTPAERAWLNTYHAQVRQRLQPLVEGAARDWLLARTQAI